MIFYFSFLMFCLSHLMHLLLLYYRNLYLCFLLNYFISIIIVILLNLALLMFKHLYLFFLLDPIMINHLIFIIIVISLYLILNQYISQMDELFLYYLQRILSFQISHYCFLLMIMSLLG
jgi:hypothetical protein